MLEHRSCAAMVWPRPQISSRSPSTVSSEVLRMARRFTLRVRPGEVPPGRGGFLKHPLHCLQVEFRRQVGDGEILVIEFAVGVGLCQLALQDMAEQVHMRT